MIRKVIRSGLFQQLLVILLLIPLLIINTRSSHNWGGDFAQYINQARCIAEGIPQSQTGYIFSDQNPLLGPPVYPPGFPLLLSPLYLVFGNSILAFSLFISCFLIGAGYLVFRIFRLRNNYLLSLLLTLVFIYNPWVLNFKASILSDIPFTFFFLLVIYLYSKHPFTENRLIVKSVLLGLLIAFTLTMKGQGIILLLAFLLDGLIHASSRKKRDRSHALNLLINQLMIVTTTLVLYFVLIKALFPGTSGQFSFLFGLSELRQTLDSETTLWNYYTRKLMEFFSTNIILASLTLVLFFVGVFRHLLREPGHLLYIVVLYLGMLLLFPAFQGFRYLLPVYPLVILLMVDGIRSIHLNLGKLRIGLAALAFIVVFAGYLPEYRGILKSRGGVIFGPQSPVSVEAFSYIREQTEGDAVIAFSKPRVLALYAERKSIGPSMQRSNGEIDKKYMDTGVNYILNLQHYAQFDQYIEYLGSRASRIWSNEDFTLYRVDYSQPFE